jgi:hypothetical protein
MDGLSDPGGDIHRDWLNWLNDSFPEIGVHLTTLVMAIISVNEMVGPITFSGL